MVWAVVEALVLVAVEEVVNVPEDDGVSIEVEDALERCVKCIELMVRCTEACMCLAHCGVGNSWDAHEYSRMHRGIQACRCSLEARRMKWLIIGMHDNQWPARSDIRKRGGKGDDTTKIAVRCEGYVRVQRVRQA
mmetsp:Transcript_31009/g.72064  ORF Transcript_31009/g.72064 Transcript_31009/m.72064 type:complete len:135 (-) Transcript_31009:233-637(-)